MDEFQKLRDISSQILIDRGHDYMEGARSIIYDQMCNELDGLYVKLDPSGLHVKVNWRDPSEVETIVTPEVCIKVMKKNICSKNPLRNLYRDP